MELMKTIVYGMCDDSFLHHFNDSCADLNILNCIMIGFMSSECWPSKISKQGNDRRNFITPLSFKFSGAVLPAFALLPDNDDGDDDDDDDGSGTVALRLSRETSNCVHTRIRFTAALWILSWNHYWFKIFHTHQSKDNTVITELILQNRYLHIFSSVNRKFPICLGFTRVFNFSLKTQTNLINPRQTENITIAWTESV